MILNCYCAYSKAPRKSSRCMAAELFTHWLHDFFSEYWIVSFHCILLFLSQVLLFLSQVFYCKPAQFLLFDTLSFIPVAKNPCCSRLCSWQTVQSLLQGFLLTATVFLNHASNAWFSLYKKTHQPTPFEVSRCVYIRHILQRTLFLIILPAVYHPLEETPPCAM